MCEAEKIPAKELEPIAIFGFDGQIQSGLKVHPDNVHLLFPLGNKISILNYDTNKQEFLCGHTNTVSNIDVSSSGQMIASGQINHMGFRAYVIIWNWKTRKEMTRYDLHKVRVQYIVFSCDEKYLVSLGGRDCGMVIVWDIKSNTVICGSHATKETTGDATSLCQLSRRGAVFISGGEQNLRLWSIDKPTKVLKVEDVIVGKLRRIYTGMRINNRDEIMYVGTMTGDIVKIRLNCHYDPLIIEREKQPVLLGCYGKHNPKKPPGKDCEKYVNGVRDLFIMPNGHLIIGAGDGTVELVEERNVKLKDYNSPTWPQLKTLKSTKVRGAVSSFQLFRNDSLLIGTEACEIYLLKLSTFELKLLKTCHTSTVFNISFPYEFSGVFATAGYESVRIWSIKKMQELLRIVVANFIASCVIFSYDGKSIISGWNDGVIRSFTPLTGKLIYAIPNAHNKGCSSLTISKNNRILVSGGCEGQVRVWKIEAETQMLIAVLKEHTGPVATVQFNCFDSEVVSSSNDGTCIIWDIIRLARKNVLFANTQFTCAQYFPTGVQILTCGSDRRVSYWEVYDASMVRDVEAAVKGAINCLDIASNGELFVSVGNDQIVKIWDYQAGEIIAAGYGHAAIITAVRFTPDCKMVISGSADGAIFIWNVPHKKGEKHSDKHNGRKVSKKRSGKNNRREDINECDEMLLGSKIAECPEIDCTCQPVFEAMDNKSMIDMMASNDN